MGSAFRTTINGSTLPRMLCVLTVSVFVLGCAVLELRPFLGPKLPLPLYRKNIKRTGS